MYQKVTRILLLCLLILSTHAAVAQSKGTYQYMQLFYYGSKTMAGPIGHFSPALRGQSDIALSSPTGYMKLVTARMDGPMEPMEMQEDTATASAGVIDLTKMTPAQRKQYSEQERKRGKQEQLERQQNLAKFARLTSDHTKILTDKVTQSLNAAAEDGWEVVQMSSFGTDGVVYLLRKAK